MQERPDTLSPASVCATVVGVHGAVGIGIAVERLLQSTVVAAAWHVARRRQQPAINTRLRLAVNRSSRAKRAPFNTPLTVITANTQLRPTFDGSLRAYLPGMLINACFLANGCSLHISDDHHKNPTICVGHNTKRMKFQINNGLLHYAVI